MEENRPPFAVEGYSLGDEGKPEHFEATMSRADAAKAAGTLKVNDAAFIKRSDLKWTYAVMTDRLVNDNVVTLRFDVDQDKNRKSFPESQWGKYIRVIKPEVAMEQAKKSLKPPDTPIPVPVVSTSVASVKSTPKVSNVRSETPVAKPSSPKPAAEAAKKVEEAPKPVAEAAKPTAEAPKPVEEAPKPAAEAPKAAVEAPKPAEPVPTPIEQAPKPAEQAPKPAPKPAEKKSGGWFSSFFGGSSPAPAPPAPKPPAAAPTAVAPAPAPQPSPTNTDSGSAVTQPPVPEDASVETPFQTHTPKNNVEAEKNVIEAAKPSAEAKTIDEIKPTEVGPVPSSATDLSGMTDQQSNGEFLSELIAPLKVTTEPEQRPPLIPLKRTPTNSILKSFKFQRKQSTKSATPKQSNTQEKENTPEPNKQEAAANAGKDEKKEGKKEWFDSAAYECDYDINPTDLFQALEARQFSYAEEMHNVINAQFNKECKTWVVARGQKNQGQLRFRALPLHAALVFGAPDDLVKKIYNAYPKATQGRDVKGRLPIHLAFEHNASDEIVDFLIGAFPKGIFVKDKLDKTPLDHCDEKGPRGFQAKYIRKIIDAKVQEEEGKWQTQMTNKLDEQKATLKDDEEFLEDVIRHTHKELEVYYDQRFELLEAKHKAELLELRKKHDSETKALLDGFEVKLNFERKLRRLKDNK